MNRLRSLLEMLGMSRLLRQHGFRKLERAYLCRRVDDASLWIAASAQDFGCCFDERGRGIYHFHRVRMWRGILIASPRVFWRTTLTAEFRFLVGTIVFELPRWPRDVECRLIEAQRMREFVPL